MRVAAFAVSKEPGSGVQVSLVKVPSRVFCRLLECNWLHLVGRHTEQDGVYFFATPGSEIGPEGSSDSYCGSAATAAYKGMFPPRARA